MSTVDGGRVRAPRPHAATAAEILLSRILDELEAIHDMLDDRLPKPVVLTVALPGDEQPQRVQEPAPSTPPTKATPRPVPVTEQRPRRGR